MTLHLFGENAVTTQKDSKVGVVTAGYRPKVPVRAIFGVQGSTWGIAAVNTDGSVNLIHRWGGDSATWSFIDISLTYTI